MATHSSVLAWRFHGQRSPADYIPWDPKELDVTEHTRTHVHRRHAARTLTFGRSVACLHLAFL